MKNELKLTQEKWNFILDLKDKTDRQQDEIDRLRRVVKALTSKNEEIETKLMKLTTNANFHDIFRKPF